MLPEKPPASTVLPNRMQGCFLWSQGLQTRFFQIALGDFNCAPYIQLNFLEVGGFKCTSSETSIALQKLVLVYMEIEDFKGASKT